MFRNSCAISNSCDSTLCFPDSTSNSLCVYFLETGVGFWFKNLIDLQRETQRTVIAIDLLGFGRSTRVTFATPSGTTEQRAVLAEDFFVESMRLWFDKMSIDKAVIVGHSLGGFLSAAFTMKHPHLIEKLILASPVGESTTIIGCAVCSCVNTCIGVPIAPPPSKQNRTRQVVHTLWDRGVFTPQSLLRSLPSGYGERLMHRLGEMRFRSSLNPVESKLLVSYLYHCTIAKRSGEHSFHTILQPGAFARRCLLSRVDSLPRHIPMLMLYGSFDWMDSEAGRQLTRANPMMWHHRVVPKR